jgi:hypothetical protein
MASGEWRVANGEEGRPIRYPPLAIRRAQRRSFSRRACARAMPRHSQKLTSKHQTEESLPRFGSEGIAGFTLKK